MASAQAQAVQDEARQQAHPLTRGKGDFRCCLTSCDQGSCAADSGSSLGFAGQLWPGPPTLVHFLICPDLPWQVRVTAAFDASPLSYISVPQSCLLPSAAHCQGEYQGSLSSCVSCLSSTQNVSPWWGGLLDPVCPCWYSQHTQCLAQSLVQSLSRVQLFVTP